MYTNTTRITGLSGSGIDTDSMVEKLMFAESSKLYRYQRNVQWKTWQQEAYRNIITKFQDFQKKWCTDTSTSLKYSSAFVSFKNSVKTSSGEESKAIKINKSTSSQSYKIKVEDLAKKDSYTSKITSGKNIEGNVKITDLTNKLQNNGSVKLNVSLDGTTKTITLTESDIADLSASADNSEKATKLTKSLNNKLATTFGTEGGSNKIEASIESSGKFTLKTIVGHQVSIASSGTSEESIYNSTQTIKNDATGTFKVSINSKDYTVAITSGTTLAEKINNALKTATNEEGNVEDISGKLAASIKDDKLVLAASSSELTIQGSEDILGIDTPISLKTSNDLQNYFGISSGTNKIEKTTTLGEVLGVSGDGSITINGKEITYNADENLATFLNKINSSDAGVEVSFNSTSQKFVIESSSEGIVNTIKFGTDGTDEDSIKKNENTIKTLSAMGFDLSGDKDEISNLSSSEQQHTSTAQDAVLTIDGTKTTRASNTIDLEGMNITLQAETNGETLTIGNETDVDAIYENISKFVEEYNTLIEDLNKQVSESRAKADDYSYYEPLTDQEKKEMDEDEIKLWEEKAKTGLVYKDSTISNILSKMRGTLYTSFNKNNGSKLALYQFGITTSSNYSDKGKLIIDETKLKDAISNNLDDLKTIFTGSDTESGEGLIDRLEDIIDSAVGTRGSLREKAGIAGTASANENTLSKQIKELNEKISAEKQRLVTKEESYYSMFSTMESSIMNSNSQLDSMLSMLGY